MHKIVSYVFYAIVLVLVVTHAPAAAAEMTAIDNGAMGETRLLTGASTASSKG